MKLTQAFARRIVCPADKQKIEYFDSEIRGFLLDVRISGGKTYYLRTTTQDGKRKYHRIGDATILTEQEARLKAIKLKRSIEEGKDVIIDTIPDKQTVPTIIEFYQEHYLPHIQKHIKSWKSNHSMFKVHILPLFGSLSMNDLKKLDIMKAHREMLEKKRLKPSTANKFLIFLSSLYHLAQDMELQGISENPLKHIKPFEENNAKERFISKKEAKRLLESVQLSQNINLKYVIPFLRLTGARRGEVLKAKWKDIDTLNMIWTIPISKNGKKRHIPISDKLYNLIHTIPRRSIYLFPSPKTGLPQNDIYSAWNHARVKAGLKDVRMHDLRHSFASALVNAGRSLYEVQTLLGHSNMKMTQRYAHLSNESLMKAVSCAGRLLE